MVQVRPGVEAGEFLAADLIAFARSRVAHYKAPRGVDFVETLPRTPTGKLVKRRIVDGYLAGAGR